MIDFHCHLDLYPDHASAVEKREKEQTYTLTVTNTPRAWPQNRDFTVGKRYVRAALGLHPQLISERASEITLWKQYLPETRYVGEVGLDAGPKHKHSLEQQKIVFTAILQSCASARGKILTVHSVRASKEVLELIAVNLPPDLGRVVLHWFMGTQTQVRRAIEMNCYFSFNVDMLRTNRGRKIAEIVPLHRTLTETDAPFTSSTDIECAVGLLADIHKLPKEAIQETMNKTFKALLM